LCPFTACRLDPYTAFNYGNVYAYGFTNCAATGFGGVSWATECPNGKCRQANFYNTVDGGRVGGYHLMYVSDTGNTAIPADAAFTNGVFTELRFTGVENMARMGFGEGERHWFALQTHRLHACG
jgi:hypothetical protein